MEREDGKVVAMGRAEIDTRAPFKSVKEAVSMFGERVLAGEIYARQLKEISQMRTEASETGSAQSKIAALTTKLGETKQSLEKSKEEANLMACRIKSLKEELEQTKKELREVKARELILLQRREDPDQFEDLKFMENIATKEQLKTEDAKEFQKKRYVKFASPPALARVIVNKKDIEQLERPPSVKKPKRKAIIPIIGWLFARRRGSQEVDTPRI